ncbi:hypothetical protein PAXRUDRAFT_163227 [Paxillus rubicundulus Ve08.2h10]|uniref:Uncharacterized protein n=1 Tax=Paxillus rubicundulus Ve08.2h10 TaxID=930991 RepID=A0A0D0CTH4_9AGAM|nr:hypothetical protein PAXRUDRAFT_163227 [Paxillus rubicundulus Ve08.2h10]
MGCHLTPYFHFVQHFQCQFLQLGPCYAIWAFPYEHNNGFLGQTNHNNHKGGELECMMMQKWWKGFIVHDLVSTLSTLQEYLAHFDQDGNTCMSNCCKCSTLLSYLSLPSQDNLNSLSKRNNSMSMSSVRKAPDLGVQSWHGDMMGDLEVVAIEQLSGQLILAPIKMKNEDYWITVAYNHVSH